MAVTKANKLQCYQVSPSAVNKLVFDQFAALQGFPQNIAVLSPNKKYHEVWLKAKDKILKNDTASGVKAYKGIKYLPIHLANSLIVFALGEEIQPLLQEIFLNESGKPQQAAPTQAQPAATASNQSKVIDLSSSTITLDNKIKAIDNASKLQLTGKLNEDESYAYLNHIIGSDVIDAYKKDAGQQDAFFKGFAVAVKNNKDALEKYTSFGATYVAQMLKEANKESKENKNFYNDVMA